MFLSPFFACFVSNVSPCLPQTLQSLPLASAGITVDDESLAKVPIHEIYKRSTICILMHVDRRCQKCHISLSSDLREFQRACSRLSDSHIASFQKDGFVTLRKGIPSEFDEALKAAENGDTKDLERLAVSAPPRALVAAISFLHFPLSLPLQFPCPFSHTERERERERERAEIEGELLVLESVLQLGVSPQVCPSPSPLPLSLSKVRLVSAEERRVRWYGED